LEEEPSNVRRVVVCGFIYLVGGELQAPGFGGAATMWRGILLGCIHARCWLAVGLCLRVDYLLMIIDRNHRMKAFESG
jgi:hypothetical protein